MKFENSVDLVVYLVVLVASPCISHILNSFIQPKRTKTICFIYSEVIYII